MKRISVDMQMARIDVTTINAKLTVRSPKRTFQVKNTPAKMNVQTRQPTFTADTKAIRRQRGLDSPDVHLQKSDSRSKAKVMQGNREKAAEGEQALAMINSQANIAAEKAKRDMTTDKTQIDVPDVREPRANPQPVPGEIEIDWDRGDTDVQWSNAKWMPVVNVEPYSVEVNLAEKPSVRITVHEDAEIFHKTEGRKVDQTT